MAFIQWGRPSPLARNIARKVLRTHYQNFISNLKTKGLELPPQPTTKAEAKLVDGNFAMRSKQVMEEGLKLEEGKIDVAPSDGGQCPAPPNNGHIFRSMAYVKLVLRDLELKNELKKAQYYTRLPEPKPDDDPLKKNDNRDKLHQDGQPTKAKSYGRLPLTSSMTPLVNGWKLVNPNSTFLEPVDRSKTGENHDWTALTRDPEKSDRMSFKEIKKLRKAKLEERKRSSRFKKDGKKITGEGRFWREDRRSNYWEESSDIEGNERYGKKDRELNRRVAHREEANFPEDRGYRKKERSAWGLKRNGGNCE